MSFLGNMMGYKLLDFGCGPFIQYTISPSRCFQETYYAEFEENLEAMRKWIKRSPGAFNWSHFFEQYAKLEG